MNHNNLKGKIPDSRFNQLPGLISTYGINTPLRMAHFLANCHHESIGFTVTVENLNYNADRLVVIFGKYFTSAAKMQGIWDKLQAAKTETEKTALEGQLNREKAKKLNTDYARNPEKIANLVYANRMGNGNEASGDGWKYRGRGDLQTTFFNNYQEFKTHSGIDVIAHPELLAGPHSLASAAFFFKKNNLWVVCDRGADYKTVTKVREKVNGGVNGLAEVWKYFNYYYKLLV